MSDPAPPVSPSPAGGRRGGPWLAHVKRTMKAESGKKKSMGKKWFGYVLKSAKKSYHKKKRGGADDEGERKGEESSSGDDAMIETGRAEGAGRRRRGSKTRRHRRP